MVTSASMTVSIVEACLRRIGRLRVEGVGMRGWWRRRRETELLITHSCSVICGHIIRNPDANLEDERGIEGCNESIKRESESKILFTCT